MPPEPNMGDASTGVVTKKGRDARRPPRKPKKGTTPGDKSKDHQQSKSQDRRDRQYDSLPKEGDEKLINFSTSGLPPNGNDNQKSPTQEAKRDSAQRRPRRQEHSQAAQPGLQVEPHTTEDTAGSIVTAKEAQPTSSVAELSNLTENHPTGLKKGQQLTPASNRTNGGSASPVNPMARRKMVHHIPQDRPSHLHDQVARDQMNRQYGDTNHNNFGPRPPPPTHRKLYDPKKASNRDIFVPIPEQVHYVELMAAYHITNTEITASELFEREALRKELQELCRFAITPFAQESNPNFNPASITLKCFGSTRAGFATRGSDMDLALVSPETDADVRFDKSIIPRLLEHVLLTRRYGARLLTRTRVPIIKVCQKPSPELLEDLIAEWLKQSEQQQQQSENLIPDDATENHQQIDGATERLPQEKSAGTGEESEILTPKSAKEMPPPSDRPNSSDEPQIPKGLQNKDDDELLRQFSLAIHEGWYSQADREIIGEFSKCHSEANGNLDDEALVKARTALRRLPDVLSRYREPKANVEFPKEGVGIHCDINFSNPLALHNTSLLRCYSLCDDRIRQMILFVKAWAKRRDINTPYNGTLSSYGFVLMVLHYAVNISRPPLAPNLQLQLGPDRGGAPGFPSTCNGYNVQFWRNEKQILWAQAQGHLTYNQESLGSLLRGFFQYYAENGNPSSFPFGGFSWTQHVLSLRTEGGLLTKEEKGWTGARTDKIEGADGEKPVEVRQRYLFAVEDPFEIDHNVARPVTHNGICAIRDEFRRANRVIKCGGVLDAVSEDMFAENKHLELDRSLKFFGPNPGNNHRTKPPGPKISGPRAGNHGGANPNKGGSHAPQVTNSGNMPRGQIQETIIN